MSSRPRSGAFGLWITLGILLASALSPALGETNQATGDIADDPTSLTDSNTLTLNSTGSQLAVVKRAYLPGGTRVPTTSTLPGGSVVDFLIYISNDSTVTIQDVSVRDVLDTAFDYQLVSIRVDNTVGNCAAAVCTPAEEDGIYLVVEPKGALTDDVDGDVASYTAGTRTVDFGNQYLLNGQLNIPNGKVWAAAIRVILQ